MKFQELRLKPYRVYKGLIIKLNELSEFKSGDKYYQAKTDDGIILLIPEAIWQKFIIDNMTEI